MSWWHGVMKLASPLFANSWLQTQQKSILSAAGVITIANLLVSITGLARDRVLLGLFADTPQLLQSYDAFRVAFQIPDLVFQLLIVGALSASFVPLFTVLKKNNLNKAWRFVNICLNYLLLFFVVVAIIVLIFAPQITTWRLGDAYTSEQISIVVNLTRIMLLGQLFFAVSSFFSGMLQSYQRFIVPALVPLLYNGGIVVGTLILYPILGIHAAGVGVIIGAFLHAAIQYPFVRRLGWRYQWTWDHRVLEVKRLFSLMPARAFTLGMNEIQNFGLSYFVTSVAGTGYTILALARSLVVMPIRFVGVPIGQASLPFLSNLSDEHDIGLFKKIVLQSLNQIVYLACPAAVLLLILRIPAVRLVFGTSNFPWELTLEVGKMIAIMAVSIPAQSMFHLLVRSFHALRDTLTPFLISLFTTCVFFIGAALSIQNPDWHLYGIALTISTAGIVEAALYVIFLSLKVKKLLTFNFIMTQVKIYAITGITTVSLYIPFKLLDNFVFNTSRVIPLLALTAITSVVGLTVYIGLSKLFRIQEMQILIDIFQKFKRKKPEIKLLLPPTEIISSDVESNRSGV